MGRGSGQLAANTNVAVIRRESGRSVPVSVEAGFPAPQLVEFTEVEGKLANVAGLTESERVETSHQIKTLAQRVALDPIVIDGRPRASSLLHPNMRSWRTAAGDTVYAAPMDRRFEVNNAQGEKLATVGDFLVQDEAGNVSAARRNDFLASHTALSAAAPAAYQHQRRASETREALMDGDLETAFAELEAAGPAAAENVELRPLSEALVEQAVSQAPESPEALDFSERVSDWFAHVARFRPAPAGAIAA